MRSGCRQNDYPADTTSLLTRVEAMLVSFLRCGVMSGLVGLSGCRDPAPSAMDAVDTDPPTGSGTTLTSDGEDSSEGNATSDSGIGSSSSASTSTSGDSSSGSSSTESTTSVELCPDSAEPLCGDMVAAPGEACWGAAQTIGEPTAHTGELAAADFDGDDRVDVLVADANGAYVRWGANALDEFFSFGIYGTHSVDVFELNGDVYVTLGSQTSANAYRFASGNPGSPFEYYGEFLSGFGTGGVIARLLDVNFDADPDLALATTDPDASGDVRIRVLFGVGIEISPYGCPKLDPDCPPEEFIDLPDDVVPTDMRFFDRLATIVPGVAVLAADGRLFWAPPRDTISATAMALDETYAAGSHLAAGDLDGNGSDDLVVASDGAAHLYYFDPLTGALVFEQSLGGPQAGASAAAIADADGDGDDDIVVASSSAAALLVFQRDGSGWTDAVAVQLADPPLGIGAGLIDDDCAVDLVVAEASELSLVPADP